ncbi:MAG: NAD(P)/FAD-dependent oxidoreductase [Bacteroidota bacterium]
MSQTNNPTPWVRVEDAIARIKQAEAKPRKILILGAGIAGLSAAYELARLKQGHEIHIVEASKRIGGRIWTHRFGEKPAKGKVDDRPYHEFGAMRIPECIHDYTWHYIKEMNLPIREFINFDPEQKCWFDLRGEKFIAPDANEEFVKLYPQMFDWEKQIVKQKGPGELLGHFINPLLAQLETSDLTWHLVNGEMEHPYLRWIDSHSLRTFLLEKVEARLLSEDALELIGNSLAIASLWSWSLSAILRDAITNRPQGKGRLFEIIGGLDLLPHTMAKRIEEKYPDSVQIHMEIEVKAVGLVNDKPEIELWDRKAEKSVELEYDQVLCTLPFPVMRLMALEGLSESKRAAIQNMQYSSSTKVLLHCKERFWEQQGIKGGRSISDRINRQTYYPSDFTGNEAVELPDCEPTIQPLTFWNVNTQSSSVPKALAKENLQEESREGVLLGSYTWTDNARQIGRLKGETSEHLASAALSERADLVLQFLERIHKEVADPDMILDSASMYWDQYPWTRGAFGATPPGDLSYYYQAGRKPEGNLFFAGEHISIAPGWIQGAMESSLAAVAEMLEQSITN